MLVETLNLLRCPFCGTRLSVVENATLQRGPKSIQSGVLGCECCAFPVVAGIPVLIADDATRDAMHALEAGHGADALHMLLRLDGKRLKAFQKLVAATPQAAYRDLLPLFCRDAEADYMVHRFSDPSYLLIESLLDALNGHGRALDICGGCGHLTRVLLRQPACTDAVVADVHFWKLWLAARIVTPDCEPVCCDANSPLPFADRLFGTVLLSDAFPYIWHKRMLTGEMQRVATRDGVVAMPHLHSAYGENHSAGDTLSPAAYRDLFAPLAPRLFDDRRLLEGVLDGRIVDLANQETPQECGDTPSITLVATRDAALYRRHDVTDRLDVTGMLAVNPLYRVEYADGVSRLKLDFPTPEYEDEFALAKRYLPASVTINWDMHDTITPASVGNRYAELRRRRVLLDVPSCYC